MSRPTDAERGARIAFDHATALLDATKGSDLFPVRLSPTRRRLWRDIRDAAQVELEEQAACRVLIANGAES